MRTQSTFQLFIETIGLSIYFNSNSQYHNSINVHNQSILILSKYTFLSQNQLLQIISTNQCKISTSTIIYIKFPLSSTILISHQIQNHNHFQSHHQLCKTSPFTTIDPLSISNHLTHIKTALYFKIFMNFSKFK